MTHSQAIAAVGPMEQAKILVVEDDPDIRKILELYLGEKGFRVKMADGAPRALELLAEEPIDLILSDVRMPGMSGLDLLRHVKEQDPEIQLVLMSAYSSVKDAVEAIQLGAADYVEKPIDFRRLERVLHTVLEKRQLQHRTRILEQRLQGCVTFEGMVACSQQMLSVFAFIERLARYPTTALVLGESGTGKELVARALHNLSPLRERPFVVCNCTTLAPTLLESELFGHVRAAFTGADRDRKGLFEAAHGGTIFLDEIGELPVGVQVKLLRVLENREIKRIGSPDPVHIDIRVIAATNRDLAEMVRQVTFRDDLFYRLNVGAIHLPPLRSRTDDIEPLVQHFIGIFNQRLSRTVTGTTPEVLDIFARYPWPGNVRELANMIERAMVVCKSSVIVPESLPPHLFEVRPALLEDDPEIPDLSLLAVIEEVHKSAPATQVLAVSADDRSETIVKALRAGADEFLPLPLDANALLKACIKVSALRRAAKPNGGAQHAEFWVAYGAKGGVGVTTLVANLGIALQAAGRRTVLLDLDLHSGDLALFLNLNPGYTLRDIATTKRLDTVFLQGTMIRHRSGLELIAAPVPLPGWAPLALTSEQTLAILKLLDTTHQVALVDTTSVPLDATRAALTNADRIFLVTELTLPALRASLRALAWLHEEGVDGVVEVVVNKYANRSWEVSPAEAAKTLGLPIRALLPRDDAAVYTAVNSGLPLEEVKGGAALQRAIAALVGGEEAPRPESPVLKGFRRFFSATERRV